MKLYLVIVTAHQNVFKDTAEELEATETDKSYLFNRRRINKSDLMKIQSKTRDSHAFLSFYTYCLANDLLVARDMLKKHLIEKATEIKKEWENMSARIFSTLPCKAGDQFMMDYGENNIHNRLIEIRSVIGDEAVVFENKNYRGKKYQVVSAEWFKSHWENNLLKKAN